MKPSTFIPFVSLFALALAAPLSTEILTAPSGSASIAPLPLPSGSGVPTIQHGPHHPHDHHDGVEKRQAFQVAELVADVVTGIASGIVNQINQDKLDRSAFTQEVVKQLHDKDPSKNYVIVHTKHEANWEGTKGTDWDHAHQEFDIKLGGTIGYEIYAAHKGNFKLKGDGGYLNWAFYGNAQKVNDKEYNFS